MESFEFYTASSEITATSMTPIIGQQFDEDLIGSTGQILHHFYASGQLWALLIGVVLGYAFKSMSSYG